MLGYDWKLGAIVGALAMTGDVISSFIKRRMGKGCQQPGTGPGPVCLKHYFPSPSVQGPLGLQWYEVLILVGAFWVLELLLSRVTLCPAYT